MGKACCCRASVFLLFVGTVLQIAAIATPGWFIFITGNVEAYRSVFYAIKCAKILEPPSDTCEFKTYKDIYADRRSVLERLKVDGRKMAAADHEYNQLFSRQVLLVVAAVLSALALLLQACRKGNVDSRSVRRIVFCAMLSAFSAGLVLSVITGDFVEVLYEDSLLSLDEDRDHTYMGFPYSIVMMLVAVVVHLLAVVTMGAHLYTPPVKRRQRSPSVSYMEYSKSKDPPMTETPSETKYAYDNKILSEKL